VGQGVVSISGNLFIKYPYLCLPNAILMYTRLSIRPIILFLSLLLIYPTLLSQEVPQPVNNTGIYEFLDELASCQIISINSAVKPYSRLFIANRLKEVEEKREQLNTRQQKELDFYLMDFGKELDEEWSKGTTVQWFKGIKGKKRIDLFYYEDSLF
jgi:hypothetical protein